MNHRMLTALLIALTVGAIGGCDKSGSNAAGPATNSKTVGANGGSPSKQDVEDFAAFARRYASVRNDVAIQRAQEAGKGVLGTCELLNTDVKRTDSALHPFVFELVVQERLRFEDNFLADTFSLVKDRVHFARSGTGWECIKTFQTTVIDPHQALGGADAKAIGAGVEQEAANDQTTARLAESASAR